MAKANKHATSTLFFLRECVKLCKPYWRSKEKWFAGGLLFIGIACTILSVRTSIALNEFSRDFYNALAAFDKTGITTALSHFAIIVTLLIVFSGLEYYTINLLSARWRRWLTNDYLSRWLDQHAHYRLQLENQIPDNPDQRISEDLNALPELTLSLFFIYLHASLTLLMFGTLLWQLTKSLAIPIGHYTLPGYIFWSAIAFGLFGTLTIRLIGKKLMHLDYQQQRYSANFRYSLIGLREASEQIAFHKGEEPTKQHLSTQFKQIFSNTLDLLSLQMRLKFFSTGYSNVALVIGIFLGIPLYLQKRILLGEMMQTANACGNTINAFTSLVNNYSTFAAWRAVILRLTELNHHLLHVAHLPTTISIHHHEHSHLKAEININLPDSSKLIEKITISSHPGDRLLITGRSGSGKSTLLRTLAGLWPYGSGTVFIPKDKTLLFLPQKPYLPIGSIKEILLFACKHQLSDAELCDILTRCHLNKLIKHLNTSNHWSQILSLGEQQLLAFAQVLIQKPDVIFLDEATSALDEKIEADIYQHLQDSLENSIIISVGHRNSLHALHDTILTLSHEGLTPTINLAA